jgi:hypothetical protein
LSPRRETQDERLTLPSYSDKGRGEREKSIGRADPDASEELSDPFPRAFFLCRSDETGFA